MRVFNYNGIVIYYMVSMHLVLFSLFYDTTFKTSLETMAEKKGEIK